MALLGQFRTGLSEQIFDGVSTAGGCWAVSWHFGAKGRGPVPTHVSFRNSR
eukprot:COSAG02_NODE_48751_length_331_cov_1.267241_1_plen_50_part_01